MDFQTFGYRLINWYGHQKRDLPWRKTKDPYKIWLSEVILQQTRVVQGLPYYERFIECFPSVFDLAAAPEEQVFKLWQGLGYYSRARNLHCSAKRIVADFQGVFPKTYTELLTLKGVGDYTASAIASICYSEPCAVVDGNVYRVLARVFGIEKPINSPEGKSFFKELATNLLDTQNAGIYNQALMDFGAIQCKPQSPDCQNCIFINECVAYTSKKVEQLPVKIAKTKIRNRYFNYLVIIDGKNFTTLNKRTQKDIWQGLYEFPLLENSDEISENEIFSTIKERYPFSEEIYVFNQIPIIHKLSHQHIHTKFWIVQTCTILEKGIDIQDVVNYPVSTLTANFIEDFWKFKK